MRMHVKTKNLAFLGVLMALTVVLVVLSGILEFNTFFLLALASFATGIAIYEVGISLGAGFYIGSVFVSFFVAPNKLYVATYAGIAFYIVAIEFIWNSLFKGEYTTTNARIMIMIKAVIFNAMYLPILLLFPNLISGMKITTPILIALVIAGQAVLVIYDKAYHYFMNRYWGRIRKRINL